MASYRLLLVDDDLQVLDVLHEMLHLKGYQVLPVSDGKEALVLIETQSFDLVITDMKMPSVNGLDIVRKVKQISPDTPVMMITGWGDEVDGMGEKELSALGIDLLLSKPVQWADLISAVSKLLSRRPREKNRRANKEEGLMSRLPLAAS